MYLSQVMHNIHYHKKIKHNTTKHVHIDGGRYHVVV